MILYIHGFASCGSGNKVEVLQQHFGNKRVISPDLPVAPVEALQFLNDVINHNTVQLLVGSSLGGYYADHLGSLHGIPAVLINPSTRPFDTLSRYVGTNTNWCSGAPFVWESGYCDDLKHLYSQTPAPQGNYLVLLQSGDEVLDYRLAEQRYQGHRVVVEQGGNHRFENLGDYLEDMDRFINAS